MWNFVLLYLLRLVHLIIMCYVLFGPFLSNHPLWLMSIILINMGIVSLWYIYGYCFMTDLENYVCPPLPKQVEENVSNQSFISIFVETWLPFLDKRIIQLIISALPAFLTLFCLIKLYIYYPDTSKVALTEPVSQTMETLFETPLDAIRL